MSRNPPIRLVFFLGALLSFVPFSLGHAAAPNDSVPSAAVSSLQTDCGTSVDDAVRAARTALTANDAAHNYSALACLLSAVEMLNVQRLDVMRGKAGAQIRVLAVPIDSGKAP